MVWEGTRRPLWASMRIWRVKIRVMCGCALAPLRDILWAKLYLMHHLVRHEEVPKTDPLTDLHHEQTWGLLCAGCREYRGVWRLQGRNRGL